MLAREDCIKGATVVTVLVAVSLGYCLPSCFPLDQHNEVTSTMKCELIVLMQIFSADGLSDYQHCKESKNLDATAVMKHLA